MNHVFYLSGILTCITESFQSARQPELNYWSFKTIRLRKLLHKVSSQATYSSVILPFGALISPYYVCVAHLLHHCIEVAISRCTPSGRSLWLAYWWGILQCNGLYHNEGHWLGLVNMSGDRRSKRSIPTHTQHIKAIQLTNNIYQATSNKQWWTVMKQK